MKNVIVDASAVDESVKSNSTTSGGGTYGGNVVRNITGNGTLFGSLSVISSGYTSGCANLLKYSYVAQMFENVYVISHDGLKLGNSGGVGDNYVYGYEYVYGYAMNKIPDNVTVPDTAYTDGKLQNNFKAYHAYVFTSVYQYTSNTELVTSQSEAMTTLAASGYWTVANNQISWNKK
jgi:hypothetical protein